MLHLHHPTAGATTSPIKRLPYDLLVEICQLVIKDATGTDSHAAPLILLLVCREWRDSAYQCAAVWSTFSVDVFGGEAARKLVSTYLRRSRGVRLSVHLDAGGWDEPGAKPYYRNHDAAGAEEHQADIKHAKARTLAPFVLAPLVAHAQRISNLRWTGSYWDRVDFSGFRGRLTALVELDVCNLGLLDTREFEFSPALRSLRTSGRCLELSHAVPSHIEIQSTLPWAGGEDILKRFSSTAEPLLDFSSLTWLACVLTEDDDDKETWDVRSGQPVVVERTLRVLPQLKSWSFECHNIKARQSERVRRLLDLHSTPALETLDVCCLASPTSLRAFITRSNCQLTRLALRQCRIRVGQFIDILRLLPALESLVIENGVIPTMITDRLFESLCNSVDRLELVPRLRELRIVGHYMFKVAKLVEMLESRDGSVFKLVELVIPLNAVDELCRLRPKIRQRVRVGVLQGKESAPMGRRKRAIVVV
ncbi:hypothetical protein FB45DRAFT_863061 [Roridomyces roridus]|uniref:F-box domain-containing protein n=1 Tax=Roridomyces roridus TaxID=1738132 RepID=A0AAD7C8Y5_9AGAR|nr:hypothetical protein FB45DRAFT_863061 [Roridomyces roridus]